MVGPAEARIDPDALDLAAARQRAAAAARRAATAARQGGLKPCRGHGACRGGIRVDEAERVTVYLVRVRVRVRGQG
jgi:hypothetical protein